MAVGVLFVAIFHGAGIDYRGTDVYAVIELLGGLAALGFAIAVGAGRREVPSRACGNREESTIIRRPRRSASEDRGASALSRARAFAAGGCS